MERMASSIMKLIGRALLSAALMLVAASPGLAEIGRAQDVIFHDQQAASVGARPTVQARHSKERPSRAPAKAPQCAFSHCAHSVAAALPQEPATGPDAVSPCYADFAPAQHIAAPKDGPDHPPRA